MTLQDYLEASGLVSHRDLTDAHNRAIIYGGSIDTALLELEAIEPVALDAALAASRGLLASPPEILVQAPDKRPWDMLPDVWITGLEAVPLAMIENRLWVALHPEVAEEAIASVQHHLPGAALTVTAECWIRMIADQRAGRATPPRYASLAARYLQAIRGVRDQVAEESLTHEVADVHVAFRDEASGFAALVDDDSVLDPLGESSTALLIPADGREPAATPGEAAPAAEGAPEPDAEAEAEAETETDAAPPEPATPEQPPAPEPTPALNSNLSEETPAQAPEETPGPADVDTVIPGLRRSAPAEPAPEPSESGGWALGENAPFIPSLVHGEPEPEAAPAAEETTIPSLRRSNVIGVIPDLKRPKATIPALTHKPPSPPAEPEPEPASQAENAAQPATTAEATPPPSAPEPTTSAPASPSQAAPQIANLRRSQAAAPEQPAEPEPPAADPDAPQHRGERERSSGYVPATLVHRQAQASTTIDALVSSAIAAGGRRDAHTARLRELGEAAFVRIAQLFPGPLDLPRGDLKSLPSASAHGPLLRLCIALGPAISPFILARLDDPDANVRFYGALLFQELRAGEAVAPLARLAFDADRDVRTIAMRVLETYNDDPRYPRAVQELRGEISSTEPRRRQQAIQAMGTLRDVDALSKLIDALDEDDLETGAAALTALCTITGQHLGMTSQPWRSWLADNRGRARIDWMIDSLEHRDPAVRRWAFEELLRITEARVAFNPRGDEADRAAGVARWRAWWASVRASGR